VLRQRAIDASKTKQQNYFISGLHSAFQFSGWFCNVVGLIMNIFPLRGLRVLFHRNLIDGYQQETGQ